MKTFRVAMAAGLLTAVGALFGSAQSAAAEIKWMDVTLTEAGTLSSQLGEQLTEIDSLVVRGPMNTGDFTTLSKAVYEGRLRVLDIEKTSVEGNKIPACAFLDPSPIMDGEFWVKPGHGLRKIILPSGVEEIGERAFALEGNLTTVVFPAGLKTVGEGAFEKCCNFINSQNLPESLVSIGKKAFSCSGKMGDITIPAGVKEIPDSAFFHTVINTITFVEGLETICGRAFEFCFIRELMLPESCVNFPGEGQFAFNGLQKVVLPENMTTIPAYFADNSNVNGVCLQELVLPKNVETLGSYAFSTGLMPLCR